MGAEQGVAVGTMWRPEDGNLGLPCIHSLPHAWWEIYSKSLVAEFGVAVGPPACQGPQLLQGILQES